MPTARVPPDRYAAFVDFAARIDRAESKAAEILPPASSPPARGR
jgi:hypothetical protein